MTLKLTQTLSCLPVIVFFLSTLFSCGEGNIFPSEAGPSNQGWVPVYVDSNGLQDLGPVNIYEGIIIDNIGFNAFDEALQFVILGDFRYTLDTLKGIQVNEAEDEFIRNPLAYFRVPGITTIENRNGQLIVNNLSDEITLSVADAPNLRVVNRGVNEATPFEFPEEQPEQVEFRGNLENTSYFQCYDPNRGVLLGWTFQLGGTFDCFLLPE